MSEIIFGTPEHVAGLSRKALEEDFQWVNGRRMELEGECERLDAENAKLRKLVRDLWLTGSLCDAIPDMRLQAKDGDWRTMQERVDEALGIGVSR